MLTPEGPAGRSSALLFSFSSFFSSFFSSTAKSSSPDDSTMAFETTQRGRTAGLTLSKTTSTFFPFSSPFEVSTFAFLDTGSGTRFFGGGGIATPPGQTQRCLPLLQAVQRKSSSGRTQFPFLPQDLH